MSRSSPSATALLHFSQHRCKTAPPAVSVHGCGRRLPNRLPRRSAPHIQWQRGAGHPVAIVPPNRLTAKDLVGCVGGCSQQLYRPVRLLRIELNAALQSCRSRSAGKNSDAPNCHGAESSLLTVCENGAVLARKRSIARQALFGSSGSEWVTTTAIGATADSRNVLRAWFRRARIPVPAGRPPTHSVVATVTYRRPSWISVRRHTGASGPAPPRIPWACRTMSAPPPDSASRSDANSGRTPIRGGKRWKVVTKSRSSQRYLIARGSCSPTAFAWAAVAGVSFPCVPFAGAALAGFAAAASADNGTIVHPIKAGGETSAATVESGPNLSR